MASVTVYGVKSVKNAATDKSHYAVWIAVTYTDNTTKMVFCYEEKVIYDVSFSFGETTYTDVTKLTKATKMNIVGSDGNVLYVYENGSILVADGLDGTYTGGYGEIVVDGYGTLTIGGATVAYTVDGNNITFVAANAMRTVALGEGTYTKVEDAYKGTYTLPDNAGTIMLDGFGGAGNGKTYVVSGTNITIFDGATSTTYGLDAANKALLGKSIFAGLTFVGSTYKVVFDDDTSITGKFTSTAYPSYEYGFTGTIEGNLLTITITSENYPMGFIGTKITATVENGKITFTSSFKYDNVTDIKNTSATCESFVFGN